MSALLPDGRRARLVAADVLGRADERAQRLEVPGKQPAGARLDQDVAERRRLDRPGHDRQPAGVGGELAQERVACAAADEVDDLDGSCPERRAASRTVRP